MDKRPISELMEVTMQRIRDMVDANTITGEPIITADGITLIPVSKVIIGFAGGGQDGKKPESKDSFGGGIGAGVRIEPVAFIVVKDDSVRMLHVSPPAATTLDRVIETVPEVVDKISDFIEKNRKDKDSE